MRPKPLKNDFTDADLEVGKPATWAVGLPAIEHAMIPSELEMGTERTVKIALTINHKRGFDCPSCAWASTRLAQTLAMCGREVAMRRNTMAVLCQSPRATSCWAGIESSLR